MTALSIVVNSSKSSDLQLQYGLLANTAAVKRWLLSAAMYITSSKTFPISAALLLASPPHHLIGTETKFKSGFFSREHYTSAPAGFSMIFFTWFSSDIIHGLFWFRSWWKRWSSISQSCRLASLFPFYSWLFVACRQTYLLASPSKSSDSGDHLHAGGTLGQLDLVRRHLPAADG